MTPDGEIYAKHRDELLRYATGLVGPSHAEDVVSTVVLRTIRRRPLTGLENPRAYLYKAVLNEARSLLRRIGTVPLPEGLMAGGEVGEHTHVLMAVWALPVRQRAAIILYYWEGERVDEIAAVMGLSSGSVKRYLFNARRKLKGALA